MISWIFFDVGNVILNDDPAQALAFVYLQQALAERGQRMSFAELLAERRRLFEEHGREPTRPYFQTLGKRYLGRDYRPVLTAMALDLFARWGEVSPLIPGIREVIRSLEPSYRLGILANQPEQAIEVLKGHGLWDLFAIHGISARVGLEKPDPRFFRWALDQAGCRAEEAVMVGDRLDNDILPARAAGMKTLQVILDPARKGYEPRDGFEKAYMEERVSCFRHPDGERHAASPADITVYSVEEIPEAVRRLAAATAPPTPA
jgi:HAD superfamily hydrolase (TIGR01549 family)